VSDKTSVSLAQAILAHPRRLSRFEFPVDGTQATTLAASNFERNRAAIERCCPRAVLGLPDLLPELEWLFARDGALSARHVDGRWFNDISVPRRAAERMLKSLAIVGTTAVLLAPTHASQVRRVLDLLPRAHALIVVIPGELAAGVIAACEDFSADITAGRLWLATGPDWNDELKAILETNVGLTPPQTMIRVPGLNTPVVEHVARPCEGFLALHAKNHKQLIALLHAKPRALRKPARRVCVVATAFSLWSDAGHLLGEAAKQSSLECVTVYASSPTQTSDLKLARSLDGCDAVVTANVGRADRPGVVPDDVPWITWATGATVPVRIAAAKGDRLVVADESVRAIARAAGWGDEEIGVATEPSYCGRVGAGHERDVHATEESQPPAMKEERRPAIVLDLKPVVIPKSIEEMSSLKLVWEIVERELIQRPLAARGGVEKFVLACADRVGVPREGFPVATFRDQLVLPTFAREVAIELARLDAEFLIFGSGWDAVPSLATRWRGAVRTAEEFAACLAATSAIIDVWPETPTHAARRVGLPLVSVWGKNALMAASDLRKARPTTTTPRERFSLDTIVARACNA
jgi:hypothetical protein